MKYFVKTLKTPVGELVLATTESTVVAVLWDRSELARLGISGWKQGETCHLLEEAEDQVREYLSGHRADFDLPLEMQGTAFQKRVWAELRKIPRGRTWSYQEVARRIGKPGASRAVGGANGKNPICVIVPCHRVVREGGELGGYTGGIDKKSFLLNLETTAR